MKHLCIKQSFFVPIIAAIIASAVFLFWGSYQSSLIIKMSSTADSEGQVFVAFGKEYSPKLSENFNISPDGKEHTYNIQLNKIFINSIRVDPATSAGKVAISKIEYGNYFFKQPIKLSEV